MAANDDMAQALRRVVDLAAIQTARYREVAYDWEPLLALLPEASASDLDTIDVGASRSVPGFSPHVAGVVAGFAPGSVVQAVFAKGVDPNRRGAVGGEQPPVTWAASNPDVAALEAVIAAGADVNVLNGNGLSPLHYAAKASPQHVRVLLRAGADPLRVSLGGETPLDAGRQPECRNEETVRLLTEAGRAVLLATEGTALRVRKPGKRRGLRKLVAQRHDAGLSFLIFAAAVPAAELARAVAEVVGSDDVRADGLGARVLASEGIFVLARDGSPWSLAFLDLGSKRPDRSRAIRLARALREQDPTVRAVMVSSGVVVTWLDGITTHMLPESPRDVVRMSERFVPVEGDVLGTPILDWEDFFARLGLDIPSAFDASNGLELALDVEGKRSDYRELIAIVTRR